MENAYIKYICTSYCFKLFMNYIYLYTMYLRGGHILKKKVSCGVDWEFARARPTKQASPDVFFAKSVGFGTNIIGHRPALAQTYPLLARCICAEPDRFWADFRLCLYTIRQIFRGPPRCTAAMSARPLPARGSRDGRGGVGENLTDRVQI